VFRRAGLLAIALVSVALGIIAVRLATVGAIGPFEVGGRAPAEGPVLPGARGKVAFIRGGDLWTYDLERGEARRLTTTGGAAMPRWSGSGSWLSFAREGQLWVVRADGAGLAPVPGGDQPESARWAHRGAQLAYSSRDGSLSIFAPGSGAPGRRVLLSAGSATGPRLAWSPDDTQLLYERHESVTDQTGNESIWTVPATGRSPQPVFVASGDFSLVACCWSGTGSYLFFWQGPRSASIAADGLPLMVARFPSSQPAVAVPAVLLHASLIATAPGSDAIAVVAGAGRDLTAGKHLIAVLPLAAPGGATIVRTIALQDDPGRAPAWPAWAPQAAAIAYSDGPSLTAAGGDLAASLASRRIWLAQPDGSQRHPLLPDATVPSGVSDERPLWARDGRTLVFARRLQPEAAARASGPGAASAGQPAPEVELWVALADGSSARRVAGGLLDPGLGDHGYVDWADVFDYYQG